MENCENQSVEEVVGTFAEENRQAGLRVFVAGGSRSGNDSVYVEEAYNLGKQIAKMEFKLDFGLSSSGIMGAVARGVLDAGTKRNVKKRLSRALPQKNITIFIRQTKYWLRLKTLLLRRHWKSAS